MPLKDQMKRERSIRDAIRQSGRTKYPDYVRQNPNPTVWMKTAPDESPAAVMNRLRADARRLGLDPDEILARSRNPEKDET